MKTIKIGSSIYQVNDDPQTAEGVLNKIIKWMEHPKHYAAHSGEGIMQDDNCTIDSADLISDIVDDYLKPNFITEE